MTAALGLPDGVRLCLFDLDGVLTQTAATHTTAWKEMFDGYLQERSARTGEPIANALDRLGAELAARARADAEDAARRVGVRAAVPLGLCLLPAFLLIGIVPVVAGLVSDLAG